MKARRTIKKKRGGYSCRECGQGGFRYPGQIVTHRNAKHAQVRRSTTVTVSAANGISDEAIRRELGRRAEGLRAEAQKIRQRAEGYEAAAKLLAG